MKGCPLRGSQGGVTPPICFPGKTRMRLQGLFMEQQKRGRRKKARRQAAVWGTRWRSVEPSRALKGLALGQGLGTSGFNLYEGSREPENGAQTDKR